MANMKKLFLCMSFINSCVFADSKLLNDFIASATTMKADFTQTVVINKKARVTSGKMEISRPNKFRWEYTKDQQLIVSDAKRIYIYDKPLEQVTIKLLPKSIDKSPASLLAGANNINQLYQVTDVGIDQKSSLSWVKVTPKTENDNNGFQLILMGFDKKNKLSEMKFTDNFGNQTKVQFSNLQTGISLPASDFNFIVPKGVDVVEQ